MHEIKRMGTAVNLYQGAATNSARLSSCRRLTLNVSDDDELEISLVLIRVVTGESRWLKRASPMDS
jgi:hypothetical protein